VGARRETRAALAAAGLRPRKRWGQHFLCDSAVARRIVALADVDSASTVLEIGPGLGALTDELARRAGRLYLVEIDPGLAARLGERHAANPRVTVVTGDALALPLPDLVAEPAATVVANLPYNVASPILFRLLDLRVRFPRAVVMVQREMAERLVAPPGTRAYGGPSVVLQAMAEVRLAFRVSPRSFVPPPRVQSAVVDVRWADRPRIPVGDERLFRAVVRAAFGQRRKVLRNALARLAAEHGRAVEDVLHEAGVDPRTRAERLDGAAFGRLARALLGDTPRVV
jgi:16S rRNA (adenine1518-N6/adenine1519-N6)-dimethyltransferase